MLLDAVLEFIKAHPLKISVVLVTALIGAWIIGGSFGIVPSFIGLLVGGLLYLFFAELS